MKQWEYKQLRAFKNTIVVEINKLGQDGWEMVSIFEYKHYVDIFFKRELQTDIVPNLLTEDNKAC